MNGKPLSSAEAQALIVDYVLDELDDGMRVRFEASVENDAELAKDVEALKSGTRLSRRALQAAHGEAPPRVRANLLAAAEKQAAVFASAPVLSRANAGAAEPSALRAWWRWFTRPWVYSLCAAASALLLFFVFQDAIVPERLEQRFSADAVQVNAPLEESIAPVKPEGATEGEPVAAGLDQVGEQETKKADGRGGSAKRSAKGSPSSVADDSLAGLGGVQSERRNKEAGRAEPIVSATASRDKKRSRSTENTAADEAAPDFDVPGDGVVGGVVAEKPSAPRPQGARQVPAADAADAESLDQEDDKDGKPDDHTRSALVRRAEAFVKAGEHAAAARVYDQLIKSHPRDPGVQAWKKARDQARRKAGLAPKP